MNKNYKQTDVCLNQTHNETVSTIRPQVYPDPEVHK